MVGKQITLAVTAIHSSVKTVSTSIIAKKCMLNKFAITNAIFLLIDSFRHASS